jgi:hypothetical protein
VAAHGPSRFAVSLDETLWHVPLGSRAMAGHRAGLPHDANSGDVYAVIPPKGGPAGRT